MILHFLKVIGIIFEVLLVFNLMIIVHELGHFLAARWRGLVIEKFGIWFGKPLWMKKIGGVEYSLGSIPAGGFVALPQLAPMEVMEGKVETPRDQLPPISVLDKIIVAFAGPLFSFLLACVFAVIVWQVGRPVSESERTRTVGYVVSDSPAAKAPGTTESGAPLPEPGLKVGDEIISVDGRAVTRWGGMGADSIAWRVVRSEGVSVEVKVKRGGETLVFHPEPIVPPKTHWWNRKGLRQIGIDAAATPMVGKVLPDSPAEKAGLRPNDLITAIDGEKLYDVVGIYDYAMHHPADTYQLTVQRGSETKQVPFSPRGVKVDAISSDPNSPARLAGVQVGDVVMGIDGHNLPVSFALTDYIQSHGTNPLTLNIVRHGQPLELKITPQIPEQAPAGDSKPRIGVGWSDDDGIVFDQMGVLKPLHPSPVEQIRVSFMSIVNTLDAVLSSKSNIGLQHMGGPVMMMRAYYVMFENKEGWRMALWFSVVLNVNLALLNLLPIPVLDGGHITLACIEALRRKPVNVRVLEYVQSTCALVIIGFMLFIAFFDVQDLPWFGGEKRIQMKFKAPVAEAQK